MKPTTIPDPFKVTAKPRRRPAPKTPAPAPAPERRPRPEKPTRYTLDLDPGQHRFLKTYAAEVDGSAAEVMRALLAELKADQELAARVKTRIWRGTP